MPIQDQQGAIERVYSDPSSAHERALKFKSKGAHRVTIKPKNGKWVVTAWFISTDLARKACE